jgi:hypothetical protein
VSWRWRRWRARHYLWAADLQYRRAPTPAAEQARIRAAALLAHIETYR